VRWLRLTVANSRCWLFFHGAEYADCAIRKFTGPRLGTDSGNHGTLVVDVHGHRKFLRLLRRVLHQIGELDGEFGTVKPGLQRRKDVLQK
jgi:hypothetical protein